MNLLALQRFDEAQHMLRELQARNDDYILHVDLYALAFAKLDSTAMAEQQQWFASKPDYQNYGLALESDTEAYEGHLAKAQELTKQAVDSALRSDNQEIAAIDSANSALQQAAYGNPVRPKSLAAHALKLAPASAGVGAEAALAFAMAGDTRRAETMAEGLQKRYPLDTQMQSLWLPSIRAQLELDRRKPTLALSALQVSTPNELGQIPFVINISCLYPVYLRGESYLAVGDGRAAAAEFQKILDHSGIVWNCWTGALAHLGLARADAVLSKAPGAADPNNLRSQALSAHKEFLVLWKDADPDLRIVREAKAEYARLQ